MRRHRRDLFEEIERDGPTEGDWTTEDGVRFYEVGSPRGEPIFVAQVRWPPRSVGESWGTREAKPGEVSRATLRQQIVEAMRSQNFYPNVWVVSDHGNAHLMR